MILPDFLPPVSVKYLVPETPGETRMRSEASEVKGAVSPGHRPNKNFLLEICTI